MGRLRPHPNVVLLMGVITTHIPFCIICEYVDSGSLKALLDSPVKLLIDTMMGLVKGVAQGLHHLHCENIVHRDLAARNILIASGPNETYIPKISDFGLSRIVSDTNTAGKTQSEVGPLKIMAPESLMNQEYSPKSDVWA